MHREEHKELKTKNSRSTSEFSDVQNSLTEQNSRETWRQRDKIADAKMQIMTKINSKLESILLTEKQSYLINYKTL